jgi:hypothetical protein
LLGLILDPEDGGDVPPKRRLTFNGMHGVLSQKITTAVRASNPTILKRVSRKYNSYYWMFQLT